MTTSRPQEFLDKTHENHEVSIMNSGMVVDKLKADNAVIQTQQHCLLLTYQHKEI
jgi:hypothetical protein